MFWNICTDEREGVSGRAQVWQSPWQSAQVYYYILEFNCTATSSALFFSPTRSQNPACKDRGEEGGGGKGGDKNFFLLPPLMHKWEIYHLHQQREKKSFLFFSNPIFVQHLTHFYLSQRWKSAWMQSKRKWKTPSILSLRNIKTIFFFQGQVCAEKPAKKVVFSLSLSLSLSLSPLSLSPISQLWETWIDSAVSFLLSSLQISQKNLSLKKVDLRHM